MDKRRYIMRVVLHIILAVLLPVCAFLPARAYAAMDIYTFKKERVDQELDRGNRGYLSGRPSDMDDGDRSTQRTLIGIDIELSGEEEKGGASSASPGDAGKRGSAPGRKAPEGKRRGPAPAKKTVVYEEQEEVDESEWIK